ncbi:MAG: sigma-70 family RNA polymerase sigma factor [Gemmatimonadetes bacterium]|nr:sigma-70 family RNA polymerase sigma factor [Gemmatimonadota bacterium]
METALAYSLPTDESALVRRAQSGDHEAFGELVSRYMRQAYYAALGLVGSHDDAMDLSQEAFARAFRARTSLDPDRPFYAWLYTILRRLCFNFLRDRKTRARKLEVAAVWLADEPQAFGEDPLRAAERSELRLRVAAAIEELPERQREVLVLKEFEGLRYREIAELLGIPLGTVMSRLYTARRHLATSLGGERP